MSMVLEMPVLATVKPEHATVSKRVRQTVYDSLRTLPTIISACENFLRHAAGWQRS